MKAILTATIFFITVSVAFAQHSGNVVFGSTTQLRHAETKKLNLTDSTFVIEAHVLINAIADGYVATIGVADSSTTLKECSDRINKRIKGFTGTLAKFNIKPPDMYVDMTTQTKTYDYVLKRNVAEQYLKGFEIKKNVIIKFKNIADLENIMIDASNFQIYDLVKVDYIVDDLSKINAQLFKLAAEVINQKKDAYTLLTNARLYPASQIYGEDYYSYYPQQLYKTYTPENSSTVAEFGAGLLRKDLKKQTTVYYDKMDYSGFDKVVNPAITEPAIEFALNLQVKFQTEKSKQR